MKKRTIAAIVACFSAFICAAGMSSVFASAEEPTTTVTTESLGISGVANWDTTSNSDFAVFDVSFSRDAFMNDSMASIGYRINDGSDYKHINEDFSYLQDYIVFNDETMRSINENTDVSDYEFVTFPSSAGKPYNVPVMIYAGSRSTFQIRVHKDWLNDKGLIESGLKVTFKQGLYADAKTTNEELSAYVPVRYEFDSDVTVTYGGSAWSCDKDYEKYVPLEEIIERADIDFSQIDYEAVHVTGLSQFVGYGDFKPIGEKSVQNTLFQLYFDKPVFYQTVDYASVSMSNMKKYCSNTMSEAQIQAWFDYRLDLAFADNLMINGRTLKEIKRSMSSDAELRIFTQYSGNPYALTIYVEASEEFYLDPAEEYSVTLKKGFRTPLFGEIKEDETFYYNPSAQLWSNASPNGDVPDYGNETEVVVGYKTKKGCSSDVGAVATLPLAFVAATFAVTRRKVDE